MFEIIEAIGIWVEGLCTRPKLIIAITLLFVVAVGSTITFVSMTTEKPNTVKEEKPSSIQKFKDYIKRKD